MEKHQTPSANDWEAFVESEKCINIKINESLDITDPLFVELHTPNGVSVQYVKGSGKEHYKKLQEEQSKNI